ncbi:bestrophin family protein [Cochlodiniinecator piscidefendens]|uniref:bestrophin family protein n=1 Tax=Cochlodiniinecator piscidefendens TaxID=2715756 RepID=UPI0014073ACF|nr:bestrophin family protein [Cochlodiniinecator piscidefendens]
MIIKDKPNLFQLLFAIKGSVLPHIFPRILALMAYSTALVLVDNFVYALPHTSAAPFAVFGIALSLFLGFRNNAAYDRWWEGRRLWGGLIADFRAFARECDLFISNKDRRIKILRLSLCFIHRHRANLRSVENENAKQWVSDLPYGAHPPCTALNAINAEITDGHRTGEIDGFGARSLSERLGGIALAQAGCERIATTPLPHVYSLLVYRTTYLYCLLVPMAFLENVNWLTPLFVGVIAYVFFGLAEVTEELENPFGTTVNGLPLDAMCRVIEISLTPHLELDPPAPLTPTDGVLS